MEDAEDMEDEGVTEGLVRLCEHVRRTFLANGNFQLCDSSASVSPNPGCGGEATYNSSEASEMRIMMIIAKSRQEAKLARRAGQLGLSPGLAVMYSVL
jgi:hypothetical protein